MELVGPHQLLSLLGDLPILGGQQLRGDRGVQHVEEGLGQPLPAVLRLVAHQVAHQGLWHRGVHAVHGHVVPVVGGPAQGQLRQIPGADSDAPHPVGQVHHHLGALPGLGILEGRVQAVHVLADVREVLAHRLLDGHLPEIHPQLLGDLLGVGLRPPRGAEAGHGHGVDTLPVQTQTVEGPHRHQQSQGGVQPSGQADDRALAPDVGQPGGKALGLHGQNQLAPAGKALLVPGCEGGGGEFPPGLEVLQRLLPVPEGHPHHGAVPAVLPGIHPAALLHQPLQVDVRGGQAVGKKLALPQQRAVLGDEVVPGEHHVRGGLPRAPVGIDIGAQQVAGPHLHQVPAVLRLANDLVAAGGVRHHRGAVLGQGGAGGLGAPQVLAELRGHGQARHVLTGEQQPLPQGDFLAAVGHRHRVRGGGEVPGLVKLPVVGDVLLGGQPQQPPPVEQGSAVVQRPLPGHGDAYGAEDVQLFGVLQQLGQALLRRGQQRRVAEQVPAGVGGHRQLREAHQAAALLRRLEDQLLDAAQVPRHLGGPHGRGGSRHPEKPVSHGKIPFLWHQKAAACLCGSPVSHRVAVIPGPRRSPGPQGLLGPPARGWAPPPQGAG